MELDIFLNIVKYFVFIGIIKSILLVGYIILEIFDELRNYLLRYLV